MNDIVVFLGPTLSHADARRVLDARYAGPAAQGDVYRAALEQPWGIAIIDGYFQRVPAVWHKEVLFALSRGVQVFGAASMGALRAAELESFGMQGIGGVFRDFHAGVLEDDDEVAVLHADADAGYRPLSEAMVNLRATLRALEQAGQLDAELSGRLLAVAKALHYPQRCFAAMLDAAERSFLPSAERRRLEPILRERRVDAKRDDALELLGFVAARRRAHPQPFEAEFHFEHTDAWERAVRSSGSGQAATTGAGSSFGALGEELALAGAATFSNQHAAALARALCRAEAARQGFVPDAESLQRALDDLRYRLGLLEPAAFEAWSARQQLAAAELVDLLHDEACFAWICDSYQTEIAEQLPSVLRLKDLWQRLHARAISKREALGQMTTEEPELDPERLVTDYFRDVLGSERPPSLARYARQVGFASVEQFVLALGREYRFAQR